MNVAHIVNRPGHEVGDKALAMCGKKHKVKALWEDLDDDHPICRRCVDTALEALTATADQLDEVRWYVRSVQRLVRLLSSEVDDDTALSEYILDSQEYNEEQEAKAIAKAEKKVAKKNAKAEKDDRPPVAPEEEHDVRKKEDDEAEAEPDATADEADQAAEKPDDQPEEDTGTGDEPEDKAVKKTAKKTAKKTTKKTAKKTPGSVQRGKG
jgi:hypothetical protein